MRTTPIGIRPSMKVLLGVVVLLAYAAPGSAILGVRRRTAVVAYSAGAATASSAAAASSSAAAQQQAAAQQTAAAQSAAASAQASAAAAESAAAASKAAPAASAQKTPQQKLEELQSLYKQGLISESDYNAAKSKILAEISQ